MTESDNVNRFGRWSNLDENGARLVERAVKMAMHGNWWVADEFRGIVADSSQPVLVRGYVQWALDHLLPREPTEPGKTFHVDAEHAAADDANDGDRHAPWKTIQRAAEMLRAGDTVEIHEGTYRECVRPFMGGSGPECPITYRAAPGEKPLLKGSDIWTPGWRHEVEGLWSAPYERHAWDYPEEWKSPQQAPMHRAEQVFVDGRLLKHVATKEELDAEAYRFLTDDESGRLWIHLAPEEDPGTATVERAMRQQVFAPAVRGLGFIHVQGLTLAHAAAPEVSGHNWDVLGHRAMMSVRSGHHWLIEDNLIEWGNAQGLDLGGEGPYPYLDGRETGHGLTLEPVVSYVGGHHTVRRNTVNYQGVAGIVGWAWRMERVLVEDNVTNFNCQKGNRAHCEAAGLKLHSTRDCLIRRHTSHGNDAFGIWLDYQCEHTRVTQCTITDNMGGGFFYEVSPGPMLCDNNVVLRTRVDSPGMGMGDGLYSHDGNCGTYVNNYVSDSDVHGVRVRVLFVRSELGKPTTASHNVIRDNFLINSGGMPVCLNPDVPRSTDNRSDRNLICQGERDVIMMLEGGGTDSTVELEHTAIGKAFGKKGADNLPASLEDWQRYVGNDRASEVLSAPPSWAADGAEAIMEHLLSRWPSDAPGLDEWYMPFEG